MKRSKLHHAVAGALTILGLSLPALAEPDGDERRPRGVDAPCNGDDCRGTKDKPCVGDDC